MNVFLVGASTHRVEAVFFAVGTCFFFDDVVVAAAAASFRDATGVGAGVTLFDFDVHAVLIALNTFIAEMRDGFAVLCLAVSSAVRCESVFAVNLFALLGWARFDDEATDSASAWA